MGALEKFTNEPSHNNSIILSRINTWQKRNIDKQINLGLLHGQARIFGKSIANWMQHDTDSNQYHAIEVISVIQGISINLCQELEAIIENLPPHYLKTLLLRYGYTPNTLEQVGTELSLTRERIRQIAVNLENKISRSIEGIINARLPDQLVDKPGLLKAQTALLNAQDMGLDITNRLWKNHLLYSGIIGKWTNSTLYDIDPVEILYSICNLLAEKNIPEFKIPSNLAYVINLSGIDGPDIPARIVHSLTILPKQLRKEIKRHIQFVGGVHAEWLAHETDKDLKYIKEILLSLGYISVTHNWFIPKIDEDKSEIKINKNHTLHHTLRKLFQFCGPLSIEDVCGGLRHAVSRTNYPVPHPEVMEEIIKSFFNYGYIYEDGKYYYTGNMDEELSGGEQLIFSCFRKYGNVVHHNELAQTFIESELSFPSLHATLKRSPLIEKFETALYKIRGTKLTYEEISRAEKVAEHTPVNTEVEYDKSGKIIVYVTLGVLALATGTIISQQLPNLSGEWKCFMNSRRQGKLIATESEFRQLSEQIKILNCSIGSRLQFIFNTWDRSVEIRIAGENL